MPLPRTSWLARPALLRTLITHVRLAVRLIREPKVPLLAKVVPILGAAYVLFPFDFLPDVIPIIGQVDDLGFLLIALEGFLRLCPPDAVAFHRAAIDEGRRYSRMSPAADFIDAEWRRG